MGMLETIGIIYLVEGLVAGIWFLKSIRIVPHLHCRVRRLGVFFCSYRMAIVAGFIATVCLWPAAVVTIMAAGDTNRRDDHDV